MGRFVAWGGGALAAVATLLVRPDISVERLSVNHAGGASRFVEIEAMAVHYRDEGAGAPLLLVHGTSSSLHTWDGWVARMAAHRRVVRLDLPGFGLTGPAPDRDYGAARLARVCLGLLDHLRIDRADVGGNSLGGRVALTLALSSPTRVGKLVLVDPAGLSGQRPPPIFRLARTPLLNALMRWVTPRFMVAKNVREVYGEPARVTDALIDRYYELLRRDGNRRAFLDRVNGREDPALDDRLVEIHTPVLIEWGARDVWIPPSFGERFARGIAGSRLVTYPNGGHVPMEELPEETGRDAEAFLDEPRPLSNGPTLPASAASRDARAQRPKRGQARPRRRLARDRGRRARDRLRRVG